jgi:hypothetical protein
MREDLNIDLVFPIRDDVSAGLMCVKAELLYDAGIISASELNVVIERAAAIVEAADKPLSASTLARIGFSLAPEVGLPQMHGCHARE